MPTQDEQFRKGLVHIAKIPEAQQIVDDWGDMKDFAQWFGTEDDMLRADIATAIHETVHGLRVRKGFPLVNGTYLPDLQDEGNAPAPGKVVFPVLKDKYMQDEYFKNYMFIDGSAASSADYYSYMMDEFNAYCHDLNCFIQLKGLTILTTPRDGVGAFMLFVLVYLDRAKPDLNAAQKELLVKVWKQAERILQVSSPQKNISNHMGQYMNDMAPILGAIEPYLGRPAKDFRGIGEIGSSLPAGTEFNTKVFEQTVGGAPEQRPVAPKMTQPVAEEENEDFLDGLPPLPAWEEGDGEETTFEYDEVNKKWIKVNE